MNVGAEGSTRMHYYVGPETDTHMSYNLAFNMDEIKNAGMNEITERQFDGGNYDVIVQGSPLTGFDCNFAEPPHGVEGSLARIVPRRSPRVPLYMIFGEEGATNFPKDLLHLGFKDHLVKKGFFPVHVGRKYIINWSRSYFEYLPPKLVTIIMESSWNKIVGRIAPSAATLLVRFRLNTRDNYNTVDQVFTTFKATISRDDCNFLKATEWWNQISNDVNKAIIEGYVQKSRINDDAKSDASFGNPQISTIVQDMGFSWKSEMTSILSEDILATDSVTESTLAAFSVDEVMGRALTLMTGKLLKLYAYNAFAARREPNNMQCMAYVMGTDAISPLDTYLFPRLFGDLYELQKEVGRFPMYGPSGMILALAMMAASHKEVGVLAKQLNEQQIILKEEQTAKAIREVLAGGGPKKLQRRFFDHNSEPSAFSELKLI